MCFCKGIRISRRCSLHPCFQKNEAVKDPQVVLVSETICFARELGDSTQYSGVNLGVNGKI